MSSAFETHISRLLRAVRRSPETDDLFNPYRDRNEAIDRARAPAIRSRNLREYLGTFRNARYVLVGEAAGYNGCRYTGIPFTGEDLTVGDAPLAWTRDTGVARASKAAKLSSEMSAKIVWGGIGESRDFVLWNAVPWHPHGSGRPLSNRKPRREEVELGLEVLELFLEIFRDAEPVAVGRVAQASLAMMERDATYVRHPSMGGKKLFLEGLAELRTRTR